MSDPLATYLHDHLAGATLATEMLEAMRDQHLGEPLGHFAAALLVEVTADRAVLQQLADHAAGGSSTLKELSSWVSEKVSRLKLGRGAAGEFGSFQALEFLTLGIFGKLALWRPWP